MLGRAIRNNIQILEEWVERSSSSQNIQWKYLGSERMTIGRAARETAVSPSAGSTGEVESWLRKWIIFHASDHNVLIWPLLMRFTSVLKAKSPAMGQAKEDRLEHGATGSRKISPDAYCRPEVSWSVIIIAGWEVWCAWQLLFPSACMDWMRETREVNSSGALSPATHGPVKDDCLLNR